MAHLDPFTAAAVIDEVKRRVSSRRVDEGLAERLAGEILEGRSWEDALALLAAVSARVLARIAASWEHPCHCDPGRVAERARLLYAALAAVGQESLEALARSACRERGRECSIPPSLYT